MLPRELRKMTETNEYPQGAAAGHSQISHRKHSYHWQVKNAPTEDATPQRRRHSRQADSKSRSVAGNARLTGTTAAILLILLAAEGFTILSIRPLLNAHIFIGMLLVPPVALKIASTGYRFVRYYLNDPSYRKKGAPPIVLRMLGPALVVVTVVLFATGIALLFVKGSIDQTLLFLHKASFVLWFGVMAIHVLGHIGETAKLAPRDFLRRTRRNVQGAGTRNIVLLTTIAIGAVLGLALLGRTQWFFLNFSRGH